MMSSTSFVVFVLFVSLLFITYVALLRRSNCRTNKYLNTEQKRISIFQDLFTISITSNQMSEILLEKYPNIRIYLSQASQIVEIYGLDIFDALIAPGEKKFNNYPTGFSISEFKQEYITAPKNISHLVDLCINAFGEIYKVQHPYKYAYLKLKKKMEMRILSTKLSLLKLLIYVLEAISKTSTIDNSPVKRVRSTQEKVINRTNKKSKTNKLITVFEVSASI